MSRCNRDEHVFAVDSVMRCECGAVTVNASVSFTVYGQLWSMKNGKIVTRSGVMVKHPKARQFEKDFIAQVPIEATRNAIKGPVSATVAVFYPSRRQDLDCELVFDLLQKAGVLTNDRNVVEKHLYKHCDPKQPRVEITIEEL